MSYKKFNTIEKKLARRVRAAYDSDNKTLIHNAVARYLNSYAARYVASSQASRSSGRLSHKTVEQIAKELNVWRPCDENVKISLAWKDRTGKPNGGSEHDPRPRVILSFGTEHRARQMLVRNLMKAKWNVAESQTMFAGGRPRAVKLVKQNFAEGYHSVFEVDVYRCFKSFSRQGITEFLCLPEKVTDYVLGARSLRLELSSGSKKDVIHRSPDCPYSDMELFMERFGQDWDPAQLGLIEGSSASPFASELLLAPVCEVLASCGYGRVVNYADNFLLMAKSQGDLRKLYNTLRKELRAHPAGPLQVNECFRSYQPGRAFEFLGYRFTPSNGTLACSLGSRSETKARKLRLSAHRNLTSSMPYKSKRQVFSETKSRHGAIIAAFPEWTGGQQFHESKMAVLEQHLRKSRVRIRPPRIG